MKTTQAEQSFNIPKGVTVTVKARHVTVEGKFGKLERSFKPLPISIVVNGDKVTVSMFFGLSKQLSCIRTVSSHIQNMITGVTKKFQYTLRLVYAHFPILATVENGGKTVEIRNFLGEKVVRKIDMLEGVIAEKSSDVKDQLVITGVDIERTSLSAALIHQSCLCKRKDIRKFLDGIYVSSSGVLHEE